MTDYHSRAVATATGVYDLASPDDDGRVRQIADALLAEAVTTETLLLIGSDHDQPLDLRVATKVALSKRAVTEIDRPIGLAVVFAMWGERRRLQPRSDQNPTGEDALHVKLDQLDWLFHKSPVDWHVYPVDDGDPQDSASIASDRAGSHPQGRRVRVLRLADALPATTGPLRDLPDVDASRKGGGIVYGAHIANTEGCDAVVITDADNSVNLSQLGLLLAPYLAGAEVVVGDRKHPEAVLVKAEARWGPGIVVLRHMQRMVGRALFSLGLRDTQAAFKLYDRAALADVLAEPSTFGFAFDSDWLYAAIAANRTIERVPFAFIDSYEESASLIQGPMTTWESLLRGLVTAARARGVDHDTEMAGVIDDHASSSELSLVVQNVPENLADVADSDLGNRDLMTPNELRAWLEQLAGPS